MDSNNLIYSSYKGYKIEHLVSSSPTQTMFPLLHCSNSCTGSPYKNESFKTALCIINACLIFPPITFPTYKNQAYEVQLTFTSQLLIPPNHRKIRKGAECFQLQARLVFYLIRYHAKTRFRSP